MKDEYRKLFDTPVDRRGTHSLKWDVRDNELPMWVADMRLSKRELSMECSVIP